MTRTLLYFSPHQDDELLTMGIDISKAIRRGDSVHVFLCTDGSRSIVRKVLKDGQTCSKHSGSHIYALTADQFVKARDREFTDSCLALGLKNENIHILENRSIDGSLTVESAKEVIRNNISVIDSSAVICTISPDNGGMQHRDHKSLGEAARQLFYEGIIKELHLFVEPYLFETVKLNARQIPVDPTVTKANSKISRQIRQAIASYSKWDPDNGRYAVGYHSVTNEFDDFLKTQSNYYFVLKQRELMTKTDRVLNRRKIYKKLLKQVYLFYSLSAADAEEPSLGDNRVVMFDGNTVEKCRSFCENHNLELRDKDIIHLQAGSSFWCLVSGNDELLCSGWLAFRHRFYISEIDYGFDMSESNTGILYKFETPIQFRGNGYYGILLKYMMKHAEGPMEYMIYTSPDNIASDRGIRKAGFSFDGHLSARQGNVKPYLKKAGFKSIERMYRGPFGLIRKEISYS